MSIRILYVDDDAALVRLVERFFNRHGFTIVHASAIDHATELLAKEPINVIALDHHLPEGDGLQFMARIATMPDMPPVVYVTGSSDMNVAVAALKAGATDFVPKSIGNDFLELLKAAVEQALEKARLKSEKEAAEREVRAARDRAEMMVREVNHRVANSLALVSAMVNLQLSAITDEAGRNALTEMQNRLFAVSMIHKRLYTSQSVGTVELHDYVSGLLDHLRATMGGQGRGELRAELEPLLCATDYAINLGVIVTEWVTNAYKYAYPQGGGAIRVSLRSLPDERGELIVEDDGIGFDTENPMKGTGLGTRLVRAMAQSMDGHIDQISRDHGAALRLTFLLRRPSPHG